MLRDYADNPQDAWKDRWWGGAAPDSDMVHWINLDTMVPFLQPKIIDVDSMSPQQIAAIQTFVALLKAERALDNAGSIREGSALAERIVGLQDSVLEVGDDLLRYAEKWNLETASEAIKTVKQALHALKYAAEPPPGLKSGVSCN